ncbi:acyltransferase [Luteolibacter yonseiensis]|uniref:Acyltransferase n=1 Tax=Luteolibacter yonseiensis TaxID=1144680 RepID=A0A934R319_9BACT|nr:acyltransferase [Luteolibacter yonseiensis]MBK1815907.1 acyltransferase [Luteolibacter yonseiensis]
MTGLNPFLAVVIRFQPPLRMSASAKSRLELLDALRGAAAIGVTLVHFTVEMEPTLFQKVARWGWTGVVVFFVISGFIMPHSLARSGYRFPKDYWKFISKRIVRLHPPYLLTVMILIGLNWTSVSSACRQFALHAGLLNGILGVPWLSQVYWTLAIEFQFYLLIGALVPILLNHPKAGHRFVIPALLCLSLAPVSWNWIVPHLPLFIFGVLVFLRHRGTIPPLLFYVEILAAAAASYFTLGLPQALVGLATAMCVTFVNIRIPRVLVDFGTISYSLYLLHPIIGVWVVRESHFGVGGMPGQILTVAAALGVSSLAAWVCYRWVESPSQRASSRIRYDRNL